MRHPWWKPGFVRHQRIGPLLPDPLVEAAAGEGVQALGDVGDAASDLQKAKTHWPLM